MSDSTTITNIVILNNGVQIKLDLSQDDSIKLNKAFVDQDVNPGPAVVNVQDKSTGIFDKGSYVHIKVSEISAILEG